MVKEKVTNNKNINTVKKTNVKKTVNKTVDTSVKKEEKISVVKEKPVKNKRFNKNILITLGLIIVLVLSIIIGGNNRAYKGLEMNEGKTDIDFQVFLDKINNRNDDKIVFLTLFMDTKTDATLYKRMIETILEKYNFSEYYVFYTNEMTSKENEALSELLGGTLTSYPMTFLIKNGKVVDNIWGYQVESSFLESLKDKIKLDDYLKKSSEEE